MDKSGFSYAQGSSVVGACVRALPDPSRKILPRYTQATTTEKKSLSWISCGHRCTRDSSWEDVSFLALVRGG